MAEEVVIVIRGDDKASPALEAAAKAIEDISDNSKDAAKSMDGMGKSGKESAKSVTDLGGAAKGAGSSAGGMLGNIKGLISAHPALAAGSVAATAAIAAAGLAFKAAFDIAQQGVEAFREQDEVNRALEQSLRNAGYAGGPLREEIGAIGESIGELAKSTNFGDEELSKMASSFLRVSGQATVTKDQLKGIADVAVGMGVSTEQAAKIMAQAMKGDLPGGLEQITSLTKGQIAAIQALKDPTERAAAAQAALSEAFGGAAENINGFYRATKNLEDAQGDLLQKIGELITESGAFEPVLDALTDAFNQLESFIDDNKVAIQGFIIDGVAMAIGAVAEFIERLQFLSPVFATVATAIQVTINHWDNLYQGVRLVMSAMQALQSQVIGRLLQGLSGLLGGVAKLAGFFNKDFGKAMEFASKKVDEFSKISLKVSDVALKDVVKRSDTINENMGNIVEAVAGWSDKNTAINKGLGAAAGWARKIEEDTRKSKDNLGKIRKEVDSVGKAKPGSDVKAGPESVKKDDKAAEEELRNQIAATRLALLREQDPLQRAILEMTAKELELEQKKLTEQEKALALAEIQAGFDARVEGLDNENERLRIVRMRLDALRETDPFLQAELEFEAERLSILNSQLPLIEQQLQLEQLQIQQGERINAIKERQIQLTMQANQEMLSGLGGILPGLDGLTIGFANLQDVQWGTKEATDAMIGAMSGLASVGSGIANLVTKDKQKGAAIEAAFNAAAAVGSFAAWAATGFTAVPLGIAAAQHTIAAAQFAAIAGGAGGGGRKPSATSASAPGGGASAAREHAAAAGDKKGAGDTIINIDFGSSTQLSSAVDVAREISNSVAFDSGSGWSLGGG